MFRFPVLMSPQLQLSSSFCGCLVARSSAPCPPPLHAPSAPLDRHITAAPHLMNTIHATNRINDLELEAVHPPLPPPHFVFAPTPPPPPPLRAHRVRLAGTQSSPTPPTSTPAASPTSLQRATSSPFSRSLGRLLPSRPLRAQHKASSSPHLTSPHPHLTSPSLPHACRLWTSTCVATRRRASQRVSAFCSMKTSAALCWLLIT